MAAVDIPHRDLLQRVGEKLAKTPASTDHLMVTKWRLLSVCQYLRGEPGEHLESVCREALEVFVTHGPGAACDSALEAAGAVIGRVEGSREAVLPSISREKRSAVASYLDALSKDGTAAVDRGLILLPAVRERMRADATSLPGIRHRFDLVAAVLEDTARGIDARARAAAAVLYVDEPDDVIPDLLGAIGMMDDDYALRMVLEEVGEVAESCLHWSEKIASLWEDLPFLQGVNLQRGDSPISVTWLDRANSYVSYSHVLGSEEGTLVLLQPSIACSPLHSIVSLIGLLVLDALTSSENKAHALRTGQTYEVDGFFVRFEGIAGPPVSGWLRLRMRDGVRYQPPALAARMIPVDAHRLSSLREFGDRQRAGVTDPMQRFFDWDAAVAPASITSRLVLVASRQRALDLLEGVQSNGVRLLDHGLVRFMGAVPIEIEAHGTLVLVVPSLGSARLLLDRGVRVQAIIVDGYERLHRGRHELPFLLNRRDPPPIISWSATGYYPAEPPTWLPRHKRLEVSSDDLAGILELDDASPDVVRASLWEAAAGNVPEIQQTPLSSIEVQIDEAINRYLAEVRSAESLPEYWKFHLLTLARTLQVLVKCTPAAWAEVKLFAAAASASIDERWGSLRLSAVEALANLRSAERRVAQLVADVSESVNSRANGLASFLKESDAEERTWLFVCERPEQVKVATSVFQAIGLRRVEAVLLRDVAVCSNCLVAGWLSSSFARRLSAHTPRALMVIADEADQRRWARAADAVRTPTGQSLLDAIGRQRTVGCQEPSSAHAVELENRSNAEWAAVDFEQDVRVPCVFLWVTGNSEAKVLDPQGRVVVEDGEVVRDRVAARLLPDDRVILGLGTARWSPAEVFTGAVIDAVQVSHPAMVTTAREWRAALRQVSTQQQMSIPQLRARLAELGIAREPQTLEGWLDVARASPIAPRGLRKELAALWPLVQPHTMRSLEEVSEACTRLRALRVASGRALLQLWRGRSVEIGVDEASLEQLVHRLRQEVQVYEVEAVTLGEVPRTMFGWWIPQDLAAQFESECDRSRPIVGPEGEDDGPD